MKDFYYILGTDSNCSQYEINEAYRKLAKKLQPSADEKDPFLESHFKELGEAYEILGDPIRRKAYDAALAKRQQRQLASFKTRHMNIALTAALLTFTALFGYYVFRIFNSAKEPKPVAVVAAAPVEVHKLKHHKRRHLKLYRTAYSRPVLIKKDTSKTIISGAGAVVKKPVAAPALTQTGVVKPIIARRPLHIDSTYTTYLKPDLNGEVYLHQLADYMSAVVTVLPRQSKIKVLEKGQSFYKVAFNDQVGYLPKWTITKP